MVGGRKAKRQEKEITRVSKMDKRIPLTKECDMMREINIVDQNGATAIHWAVRKNSIDGIKRFLLQGGSIDVKDINSTTALEWAVALDYHQPLLLLLSLGASIDYAKISLPILTEGKNIFDVTNQEQLENAINEAGTKSKLDLSFLFFQELPQIFIIKTLNLKELILSFNSLTELPEEIFQVPELRLLDISHNMLNHIQGIEKLTKLETIICSYNYIEQFPCISTNSEKWTNLDMSNNALEELPSNIGHIYRLQIFNCSHNFIKEVPKSIIEASGIRHLDVSHNFLTHLRDIPINLLSSLEHFDLSYNKIKTLPCGELINSPVIKTFFFSHNHISLPLYKVLRCYYAKEDSLNLSSMGLSVLPKEVVYLTHLKHLDISNNHFEVVPNEIRDLENLLSLDLSFNQVKDLPLFFHRLSKLQTLNLEDTSKYLISPPKSVVERGVRYIMDYYSDLLQGEPCFRLKLMFVGQENVGKTTLLHALKTSKIRKKQKKSNISTDGIDIARWQLKTASKQALTFSAWDFAGQEIYYATHSLFLSSQAIYLIIFDLRHPGEARIEFWLNSVASRATSAPVMLVGTHRDDQHFIEHPEDVDKRLNEVYSKYSRFKNIKRVTAVSATDYTGINQLTETLGQIGMDMPSIRNPLPKIYQSLEDLILEVKESENPPAVTWKRFSQLASRVNFKDEDQLLRATNFLNDLGSLVFFEEGNERLIVLDPQWLTAMFASVITTRHNYSKNGILKHNDIGQIWRAPQYPLELHGTLLALLKKFEIIYELPLDEEEKRYLIPNLLPEERPPIDLLWLEYDHTCAQYARRYTLEFIPNGMFSKLMVRFLHFIDVPLKFWRTGVVAQQSTSGNKALIEMIENTLHITVRGDTSAKLLRVITEIVDTLINSWFKVAVTSAEVPCPHCIREQISPPGIFDLLDCEMAAARLNARVIHCPIDRSPVRLDRLVPDIAMTDFQGSQIFATEIILENQIGKGSFGEIFKGKWRGELVAIKRLKADESAAMEAFAEFRREVWLMTGLCHPCIVTLKGFCNNPLMMVMECVTGGDLFGMIHDESIEFTWDLRLKLASDMAHGMAFLHGINPPLIHRDLKSPNVLVMKLHPGIKEIAKIADFGLSSRLFVDVLKDRAVENPTWCAPETLRKEAYTEKVDVYSYGVMLWELLTRELPFDNIKHQYQVEDEVLKGNRPSIPSDCFPSYADLIKMCWAQDPAFRPSFTTIITMLQSIVEEHIGMDKMAYPFFPIENTVHAGNAPTPATARKNDTAAALHGNVTKRIHVNSFGSVTSLVAVTNQVWVAASDGSIHIFSAESGRFLKSYNVEGNTVTSLAVIDSKVWSGSNGTITTWSVDDLVTVDVYDVKVRSEYLNYRPQGGGKLFAKKSSPRFCELYKSGYFRLFKQSGDEEPLLDIFLKNCTVGINTKGRLAIQYGQDKQVILSHRSDPEEIASWLLDFRDVMGQFSLIPAAQESVRKVNRKGDNIDCIQLINENRIMVGSGDSLFAVDSRARSFKEKENIPMSRILPGVDLKVNAMLDTGVILWVAVNNQLVRVNSSTSNIVNALSTPHTHTINALLLVGDEVWVAADDSISCWDVSTANMKCVLSSKKGKFKYTSLVETETSVWVGTDSGSIIYFEKTAKVEEGHLKQHKSRVSAMSVIMGLVWSCAENEVLIWK